MLSLGEQGGALIPSAAGPYSLLPTAGADDELARGVAWARRLMVEDRAASTRDKYARDWALFVHWMGDALPQHDPCPAHPAAVGTYVGVLRDRGLTKQTILGRIAAIIYVHELCGHPSPMVHAELKRELRGLRRQRDTDRQDRRALERDLATQLATQMLAKIRAKDLTKRLLDQRDVAIFSLGWLSALRRSTIAALRRRDVTIKRDDLRHVRYLEIFVPHSKTDQEGKGRYLIINELPEHEPLCAVRAVKRWLDAAGTALDDAPLFPTFAGRATGQHLTDHFIDGRDVARAVKRIITMADLRDENDKPLVDEKVFAAHALRRGFATSAINKGVRKSLVREHGGWKTDAMLDRYTRVDQSRDNAVSELFS